MTVDQRKLEVIQIFRGIAALMVVMYHADVRFVEFAHNNNFLFNIFKFGYSGVDFFFVLSGFIIFYVHHKDFGQQRKRKSFFIKRFIRVYPIYWLITFAVIPILFLLPSVGEASQRNLLVIIKSILLFPQVNFPVVPVAWTLTHEIKFYLIFGLLLIFNQKNAIKIASIWLIFSALALLPLEVFKQNFILSFIFSPLNLEFAMGCFGAYIILNYKVVNPKVYLFIGSLLFLGVGVLENLQILSLDMVNFADIVSFSLVNRIVLFGIPATIVVIGAAMLKLEGNQFQQLRLLGNASYSIYLVHHPLMSGLLGIFGRLHSYIGYNLTMLLISFVAVIVGVIFHFIVEQNLIKFLRRKFFINRGNLKQKVTAQG